MTTYFSRAVQSLRELVLTAKYSWSQQEQILEPSDDGYSCLKKQKLDDDEESSGSSSHDSSENSIDDSPLRGLSEDERTAVYTEVSLGCLDIGKYSIEDLIQAVADGDMDVVGRAPLSEDVERRGVLCLSYMKIPPEERYGKANSGVLDPASTGLDLRESLEELCARYKNSTEVPYLWFDQVLSLRIRPDANINDGGHETGWELRGLLPYLLYPVLFLAPPGELMLGEFLTRLWPIVEVTLAGVGNRIFSSLSLIYEVEETKPVTIDVVHGCSEPENLKPERKELFRPSCDHLSSVLPTLMKVLEECDKPLETYHPHDRSKILWWILRFVQEVRGNADLAGIDVLRAALRITRMEQWSKDAAKMIALNYGAIHAAGKFFAKNDNLTIKRTVLASCRWHGYVDCIPGLRHLCAELDLDPAHQHTARSVEGEELLCYESTISEAIEGGEVRAVHLDVKKSHKTQYLIPVVHMLVQCLAPVRAVQIGLDKTEVLYSDHYLIRHPTDSAQVQLSLVRPQNPPQHPLNSSLLEEAPWVSKRTDVYFPCFDVPVNPVEVLLNLDDRDTVGGNMKYMLLQFTASAVEASRAIVGKDGVGKTCLLRGIGCDKDVINRYSGGIYWLSFGEDVDEQYVINQIAQAVKKTNGNHVYECMMKSQSMDEALSHAKGWFRNHCCLFLCDDLWSFPGQRMGFPHKVQDVFDFVAGSCMLFSVRDWNLCGLRGLANSGQCVSLKPYEVEGSVSEQILCCYAGCSHEKIKQQGERIQHAFNSILASCKGFPLALAIAGRTIAKLGDNRGDVSGAWMTFSSKCRRHQRNHERSELGVVVLACLEIADSLLQRSKRMGEVSISEMFRSLCIVRKCLWTPSFVLAKLWGSLTTEKTLEGIQFLAELNLVEYAVQEANSKDLHCIRVHESLHGLCVKQAIEKDGGCEKWHRKLLETYIPAGRIEQANQTFVENWWSTNIEDDGYIHSNLARHLVAGGQVEELEELVLDFRWTQKQSRVNSVWTLERDFEHLVGELQTRTDKFVEWNDERWKGVDMIARALRLSRRRMLSNSTELGFQLFGRLNGMQNCMNVVKRYLTTMEVYLAKPFARPITKCLTAPGGQLLTSTGTSWAVFCVAMIPKTDEVVVGGSGGHLITLNYLRNEVVRIFYGHTGHISSVVVSPDQKRMISSSGDGTIGIWNMETGKALGERLVGHKGVVAAVAISPDGGRIVSAGNDGMIRIWDIEFYAEIRNGLNGHEGPVNALTISPDGALIVSGGNDGTIRIWKLVTGECVRTFGHQDIAIGAVDMSPDGRLVVSSGYDGMIRKWDAKTGKQVGDPMRGHYSPVSSLAMSSDGVRVVSSGTDCTVRLWDLSTGCEIGEALCGHNSSWLAITMSSDGKHVVSGGNDGVIKIWEIDTDESGKSVYGHRGRVTKVAASVDGHCVASIGEDNMLRTWRVTTGEAIGEVDWCKEMKSLQWFAPATEGELIVSGHLDGFVKVWSVEAKGSIAQLERNMVSLVFMPASALNSCGGSGTDRIVDKQIVAEGKCLMKTLDDDQEALQTADTSSGARLSAIDLATTQDAWGARDPGHKHSTPSGPSRRWSTAQLSDVAHIIKKSGVHGGMPLNGPRCRKGDTKIYREEEKDEGTEFIVLGRFDSVVVDWTFSTTDNVLIAGLEDGTVAFVRMV